MRHPCYDPINKLDCPSRKAGCSATCPKWKEYLKCRDAKYKADKKARIGVSDYYAVRDVRSEMYRKHQLRNPKRVNTLLKGDEHE